MPQTLTTRCCVTGGGPAGMMLGYLLARAGVPVIVLEKHGDFLRDFRGDTVHPSTLEILDEIGLLEKFQRLPIRKVQHLGIQFGEHFQPAIDLRGLKPFDYLALVPQWDFLNLLAKDGQRFSKFSLRMNTEATALIERDGRVVGVRANDTQGEVIIEADVVVACDGRHSTLRKAARMKAHDYGAPMDVLWFRMPRSADAPEDTFGIVGAGHMMVLLNRNDYWQAAYVVPKGDDVKLRAQPIETFRNAVIKLAPFLANSVTELTSWEQLKTLEVRVDRLERWCRSGLLLIGDAAHAMSPIGGVGINLAIQDAVAASNLLAPALLANKPMDEALLRQVQRRRLRSVKLIQFVQLQIQKRVISRVLEQSTQPPKVPAILSWLLKFRRVRNIPARIVGYGFWREHVRTRETKTTSS